MVYVKPATQHVMLLDRILESIQVEDKTLVLGVSTIFVFKMLYTLQPTPF